VFAAIEGPQLSGQRQSRNRNYPKIVGSSEKGFFTLATIHGTTFAFAAILFKPKYNRAPPSFVSYFHPETLSNIPA
jgi:hypothetical protein